MKRLQFLILVILLFSAVLFNSCDNQKAGTFAVKFSWAKDGEGKDVKPDISTGDFFVTVRIYEWKEGVAFPGDIAANGKQLIQSDPAQMKATGTSIDFGDLSYGSRRFVLAEIRKGAELTGGILFTGMSQLFDFKAGHHTEVNVNMSMTPTPGVDEDGKRIDAELRIVDDNGNLKSYTSGNDLKIKLRLLNAVSFTHVYFANKEENIKTANGKSYKIGELKKIEGVDNGYELDGEWDLSFGLTTDEIAVSPELKVYARLENEYGTGLLVMAKIALDNQLPTLTLGLNPAYTNGSKTITLNISANELILHNTLNIQASNEKLKFNCPAPTKNESLSFTCMVETLDATLKDGDYEITVIASDQAGNVSQEGKTTLTIDRESPELTFTAYKNGTEIDDTIYLKENDKFKVDLTLSKEPAETPVVRLGSAGINCEKISDLKYSCTTEIKKETYAEGISDLSVNYQDMAENQFSGIIVSGIRLDYTAPVLNTQIVPGNKSLNASQILQITVNASEELSSAPTVTLAKNGGGAITLDNTEIQGLSYIYTYPTLVDGTYSFTADATDLAGHNAPQVSITSIISDSSVPTVSETVTVNPTRIKPSATSTITFTVSEKMNDTGDTVEVKVGDGTAACNTANGLNYFCAYTGTAGTEDSIETVIIKLTDASANTSTGSHGTVYVDRTAPAITIDLNKNAFNSSDIIRVSVTSSEELVSAPAVEIPEISMSLSNVTQVSNFSWIFTVDPADLIDDDYTVTAEGVDLVSLTGSDIAYFSVDSSIPDLVTGTIDRTKAGLNITYTVDFEITEPVAGGIPVVKANDIVLTNCVQNGSDKIFKCSRTVGAEETDSTVYAVIATLTDEAGNSRTVSIGTLLIDKIPPNVVPGSAYLSIDAGADCELAQNQIKSLGNGSSAHISLQLTEKLETGFTPVLVARKSGAADRVFTLDAQSGLTLYFSHSYNETNPPEEYSGEYALYLSLKDEAGNVAEPIINSDKSFKIAQIKEPKLVINQDLVSYTRSPWGRSKEYELKDEGGITQYTVPANEYYELGPVNFYEATDRLPAETFILSFGGTTTESPVKIKVKDKDLVDINSRFNSPNHDGTWPRTRIWSYDSKEIYVSGIDGSCRETPPKKVRNVNWITSMNKKIIGNTEINPHKFETTDLFFKKDGLAQRNLQEPEIYDENEGQVKIITNVVMSFHDWKKQPVINRYSHDMIYDSFKNNIIVFGGYNGLECNNETWKWNGVFWTQLNPVDKPSKRYGHSMSFDSNRGKLVLFGGYNGDSSNNETWEWDGYNWNLMNPVTKPVARYNHAMIYDSDRKKTILFGGSSGGDETWEWDGTNWFKANPTVIPSVRSGHKMVYDQIKKRVYLFGGISSIWPYFPTSETWEWNGLNWTKKNPVTKPAARYNHAMVYDSAKAKTILFGGRDFSGGIIGENHDYYDDSWEWDGTNWTKLNPVNNPSARSGHAIAFDSFKKKIILLGGYKKDNDVLSQDYIYSDTWEWDGANWIPIISSNIKSPVYPPDIKEHSMIYDIKNGKTMIWGGISYTAESYFHDEYDEIFSDTFEWNGTFWDKKTTLNSPSERYGHATAYDILNQTTVLFGGYDYDGFEKGDTWLWNDTNWELASSNTGRSRHAMTYDRARSKVVLFGGYKTSYKDDTWEWNGSYWLSKNPSTKPSARREHSMTYDVKREKVVLFGGFTGANNNETWEWDGNNWTQKNPLNKPSARYNHSMVYHNYYGKVILFGGYNGSVTNNETWEWDGENWNQLNLIIKPSARQGHSMAFDSIEGKVLMFGGSSGDTGMWAFESGWNDSPGQIFTSYVYYYQQPDIFQYSKVYFRSISGFFNAGGVGDVQGSAINGVDLIAWKNGSWETVSSNDAGVDDLKSVLGIFSNDHEEIKSILNGNSSNIYIAAIPKAPRGFGTVEGQIASDYMEMILSYTILEPDDFAPTGHLDGAGADFMWGWACDKDTPEENIHVVLSFYTGETYLTSIDIGETNNPSEQGVQDICGEGSTTHRFSFNPSTSAELQQALHDKFISRPVTLTVHAYGMNTGPVPPGSNTELGDSPKEFVY